MKRIFDPALLDFYLQKYEIPSLFNIPGISPFPCTSLKRENASTY